MAVVFPAPYPRDQATLSILRKNDPFQDHQKIREAREKMAEITRQPQPPEEPRVVEMEKSLDPEDMRTTIMRICPQNGSGPSGQRYRHLQAAISTQLVDDVAAFTKTFSSSDPLLDLFWSLLAGGALTALREKACPVTCVDDLWWLIGGVFCRQHSSSLRNFSEPSDRYGVRDRGGIKDMTEQTLFGDQRS